MDSMRIACVAILTWCTALSAGETPRIDWDAQTVRLVQPGAGYARMVRLPDHRILITYSLAGKTWVRPSADEGATWGEPVPVLAMPGSTVTNAEITVLRDGRLLALGNERPPSGMPGHHPRPTDGPPRPFRILSCQSGDAGRTWSAAQVVFSAGTVHTEGCWEPVALELPDREIQLCFANEAPYDRSHEQEISLMRSRDQGLTWSAPERISFRARHRDGMPVPILLADGGTIAMAIEDDGLSGTFKPVIVATTLADAWRSGTVTGDHPQRWSALATPLPATAYAGAPFLRQLPDGATLLSYQESATGPMEDSRMVVCIGDAHARHFASPSLPFPDARPQLWNALFVRGPTTVTAITSATIAGRQGVWIVDGTVVTAAQRP